MKLKRLVKQYYFLVISFTVVDFLFGSGYVAFMSEMNISESSIGLILSIWSGVALVFGIPLGVVADNWGRKKVMGIGFLVWGAGLMMFPLSRNTLEFGIAIFLVALGLAIIGQLPLSWFVSSSNELRASDVQDKSIPFAEALSKGVSFCTGILFTVLALSSNGTIPYYIASLFSLFTGIMILWKFDLDSRERDKNKISISSIKRSLSFIKENKILGLFFVKCLLGGVAGQLFVFCWQLYLVNSLKVSADKLGIIFSFFILTLAFGYYFTSKVGNNFNKMMLSLLGNIVIVIAFLTMFFGNTFLSFMIASLLFEFGLGVEQGANLIWIQPEIEESMRATTLSLLSVILGLASLFASWIISFFLAQLGFKTLWLLSAILTFFAIGIILKIKQLKSDIRRL